MGMGRLRDFTETSLVGELQFLPAIWRGPALVLISMLFKSKRRPVKEITQTVQA